MWLILGLSASTVAGEIPAAASSTIGVSDEAQIAAAMLRRDAALRAVGCEGRFNDMAEEAAALAESAGRSPRTRADAFRDSLFAIEHADRMADACPILFAHMPLPRYPPIYGVPPVARLREASARLEAWNEPQAALAWSRLADLATSQVRDLATLESDAEPTDIRPDQCRCMGALEPMLPVTFGYHQPDDVGLWEFVGLLRVGGCEISAPVCPTGCWPDTRQFGARQPVSRMGTSRFATGWVLVLAGNPSQIRAIDKTSDDDLGMAELGACLGPEPRVRVQQWEGAWYADPPASKRDSSAEACLLSWAARALPIGIDTAGVLPVRSEPVPAPDPGSAVSSPP